MYEDLNQIATLRFNRELESISRQTREKVREMQNEYAAPTNSSGVRSGPQEAAIGRAQIEGSERLVHALYEIWVDLIKRRNGYVSRPDVDFIARKLEGFAQTQKGHLHKAFSGRRMGAVVNPLTEEAGRRLYAATANARRDLTIMVQEHELFSRSTDAGKRKSSGAVPASEDGHQPHVLERPGPGDQPQVHRPEGDDSQGASERSIRGTIGKKIWSWVVVSVLVALALGLWGTFLTSGHPWAADMFYVVGALTFLAKFLTWEDARQQPGARKKRLLGGMTILVLILSAFAIRWDHTIDRVTSTATVREPLAAGTEAARNGSTHAPGSSAPIESKPQEPSGKIGSPSAEGQTLSVAERVKIIIAGQLQVNAAQLKPADDFEADLGADPAEVYLLMRSLELEYNITIPDADSKDLHTVGETMNYIARKVQEKQAHERSRVENPVSSGAIQPTETSATTPTGSDAPSLHYILESDFDDEVLNQGGPVLVFFCRWSQDPCGVMAPTISSIAQERRGILKTVAIDVIINKELAERYNAGYSEDPVTILFSGGAERGRITGAASKEAVEHLIDKPEAFAKKEPSRDSVEKNATSQDPLQAVPNVPESEFNSQVLRSEFPVLVYFYSPDDACKQVSPLVAQVAGKYKGTLKVVKVDSYTESQLASEYDAGDYRDPLLIAFKDGEARGVIKGTTSIATIENLIQRPESFAFKDDELPNVTATLTAIPDLHEAEFDQTLKGSGLPTLVYFYDRDDDPACRAMARVVAADAKLYKGKVNFLKINSSTARDASYEYRAWGGPVLVLFKGTNVKDRKYAPISKEGVAHMLDKALSVK